jgi:hypothetical protein
VIAALIGNVAAEAAVGAAMATITIAGASTDARFRYFIIGPFGFGLPARQGLLVLSSAAHRIS